ncbi:MAG: hypothetical protein DWB56_07715 [Candidatus Jettenia sp.]|nr:MAG: hypothetical protein EDM77_04690 [Candidatus Jettenia sp. AMX1]MBC6928833.1 hypothetical protein [Candidatus Jettenia sp.]WKZ17208.1 MAG: hypothetical protein QY317_07795 [Candidatus Jettenia caeni]MCE7881042.1 hypothetical protein [Candidatus Jettenia sp. AMX1]MCQ3927927.1 hypothetical protein [Candidatus Jettenia sp.]
MIPKHISWSLSLLRQDKQDKNNNFVHPVSINSFYDRFLLERKQHTPTPIVETQDVAPLQENEPTPNPSQEGSIKVPSWEGIEGWVDTITYFASLVMPALPDDSFWKFNVTVLGILLSLLFIHAISGEMRHLASLRPSFFVYFVVYLASAFDPYPTCG